MCRTCSQVYSGVQDMQALALVYSLLVSSPFMALEGCDKFELYLCFLVLLDSDIELQIPLFPDQWGVVWQLGRESERPQTKSWVTFISRPQLH